MSSFLIPMSLVSESLVMSASDSALLLVARKPYRMDFCIKSPLGEVRTRPMPDPFKLLEPSIESVHLDL